MIDYQEIFKEKVAMSYRVTLSSTLLLVVIFTLVLLTVKADVGDRLWEWYWITVTGLFLRLVVLVLPKKYPVTKSNAKKYYVLFVTTGAAFISSMYVLLVFNYFPQTVELQNLVYLVGIGISAGAVIVYAMTKYTYYVFALPIFIGIAIKIVILGDKGSLAMVVMAIAYALSLFIAEFYIRKNVHNTLVNANSNRSNVVELNKISKALKNNLYQAKELRTETESNVQVASLIQQSLLNESQCLESPKGFKLFKPRDVVSGDFYWSHETDDYWIAVAGDCTGHGVPGAILSVFGIQGLNSIDVDNLEPGEILDELKKIVTKRLKVKKTNLKDGMDIAICKFYKKEMKLTFAGAQNPLYLYRKDATEEDKITIVKGDKQPIGMYFEDENFVTHTLSVESGDMVFLFSDGFPDQFGGEKGKKYKYKPFRLFLGKNAEKPVDEQLNLLTSELREWKGELDQVDDVCILGIRI